MYELANKSTSFSSASECMTIYFIFPQDLYVKFAEKFVMELRNMKQHQHTIHEKSDMFSCTECDYTTLQKSNLNHHMKRHTNTPLTPNLPPKVAHCEPIPNIINPVANDHLLEQLEHEEIQSMFDQNIQCGFGVTQMNPTDAILLDDVHQFFQDEQPWGTDQYLHQVYVQNF